MDALGSVTWCPSGSGRTDLTSAVCGVFTLPLLQLLTPRASGIRLPLSALSMLNSL